MTKIQIKSEILDIRKEQGRLSTIMRSISSTTDEQFSARNKYSRLCDKLIRLISALQTAEEQETER
jgi:hypothetical protein